MSYAQVCCYVAISHNEVSGTVIKCKDSIQELVKVTDTFVE